MAKMTVVEGAGIRADNIKIVVKEGETTLYEKTYYCGYDYSWDRSWATEKKPFRDDLIESIKKQYSVTEIEYLEGKRLLPTK